MENTFLRKMRVALTPTSSLLRTRLKNGAIVAGYNRPGYGGRGIYIHGESLEPELAELGTFLRPGSVFIDIGANVGVYTVKAAKEVQESGLVIAVEPFIESAQQLLRNVRANHYGNVRIRNFCMGRKTESTVFYLNKGKPNSFGLFPDGKAETLSVLSVSLDDLCRWEALDRLDYLKIDAEGAEGMILEGGIESINLFRPIIQVEIALHNILTPAHYRRFSTPGVINHLFIPEENRDAIRAAQNLKWEEASVGPRQSLASIG
jgi:FkbM family methyltransferase